MDQSVTNAQDFKQVSNIIFFKVLAVYGLLIGSIALLVTIQPALDFRFLLCSALAWLVIGWCQFALFNALHEGLHNRFGDPHREFLAYALTAYPVGFDQSYKSLHMNHHKYFGDSERDPDYANYSSFPSSKRQFLWRLFLNLSGYLALLQVLGVRQSMDNPGSAVENTSAGEPRLIKFLLAQFFVLLLFGLTVGWYYYLWLWVIPVVTVAKFFTSTRTFCEHASPDDYPTIRTITGSWLGEKILGVFCFHYHAEHHRFVAIPCNRLKAAHYALQEQTYAQNEDGEPRYELYRNGYFRLLYGWFKCLPF